MDTAPRRPGRPPRSQGPATRDRLLDAALELFARQGFAATTVRQIGGAVGVRDSAIYAHFSSKQAIYDALLAGMGPLSFSVLGVESAALAEMGPSAAVHVLAERLVEAWTQPRAMLFAAVMAREGAGAGGTGALAAAIDEARAGLEEPFRRWQEDGLMRADVPVRQLVWELFAPLHVVRLLYLRGQTPDTDPDTARDMIADHVGFFLTCVTTHEGER
ncbi:TetR/AcrR family transcriptional regulator [Nonomuraea sp. NPDC004354]